MECKPEKKKSLKKGIHAGRCSTCRAKNADLSMRLLEMLMYHQMQWLKKKKYQR